LLSLYPTSASAHPRLTAFSSKRERADGGNRYNYCISNVACCLEG
jgi:hypothetical protein